MRAMKYRMFFTHCGQARIQLYMKFYSPIFAWLSLTCIQIWINLNDRIDMLTFIIKWTESWWKHRTRLAIWELHGMTDSKNTPPQELALAFVNTPHRSCRFWEKGRRQCTEVLRGRWKGMEPLVPCSLLGCSDFGWQLAFSDMYELSWGKLPCLP